MTTPKRSWRKWAAAAVALATAVAVFSYFRWFARHKVETASSGNTHELAGPSASGPVVPVKTAPLREATITETTTAYGTVVSQLGDLESVSLPFETRVSRVHVTPGQRVTAGEVLLEAEPSPATVLQLKEAHNTLEAAAKQLQQTERRYAQNLATNQELLTVQADLRSAQAKLDSLEKTGAGGTQALKASLSGIISKVDVQIGQTVAAGTPMVEIAADRHIEVLLGVEPENLRGLRVGEPVQLSPVHAGSSGDVLGQIRLVTQRVNPSTRLVDIFVSIPATPRLLLGAYVQGRLTTASKRTLVAPREAALPEGERHVLFTVKDRRAVKHLVTLGLENDREVEIVGGGLAAGERVIVSGNYELRDGMAVDVEQPSRGAKPAKPALAPRAVP